MSPAMHDRVLNDLSHDRRIIITIISDAAGSALKLFPAIIVAMYGVFGFFLSIGAFFILPGLSEAALSCLDSHGDPIDWFNLYKLPKKISTGLQYFVLTERDNDWRLSSDSIDDPLSIPGQILRQLTRDHVVLMYNDEPPEGETDGTRGHTKGVIATDAESGFWLIHSVPKYPSGLGTAYMYPKTGTIYGQSFLCVTFNATEMDTIGLQLMMNEPHLYEINLPEKLKEVFPNLVRASNMMRITTPPFWRVEELKSRNGSIFRSFAKSAKFQKELYTDWVAPTLGATLMVESWLHGPGRLESNCSLQFGVFNLRDIIIHLNGNTTSFRTLDDHSKWAVSLGEQDWICVGDINRSEHQKVRGGGTLCRWDKKVATAYRNAILDYYPCPDISQNSSENYSENY
ncbi:plancitoxin-1 [Lutzomyia longipalpis]|uniref:plancitoxin-1 n=1 Tax=Lutzomyia longipalpis TaxID=7200 RepID=UPI002483AE33|nr:plancitoxin-1 [Lutzomyia longipalpis]